MELLNQPFNGQLGTRLIEMLDSGKYNSLTIVVAFAKNSGVLRIKDALERFREGGGVVKVYLGIDLGGTSHDALSNLLTCVDSLNIVHAENRQTFHTKIYNFVSDDEALMIVGSHNLTAGGLWTNFESSVLLRNPKSSTGEFELQETLDQHLIDLESLGQSFMPIDSQEDIDRLAAHMYVEREMDQIIRRKKDEMRSRAKSQSLFAKGLPANLPNTGSSTTFYSNSELDTSLEGLSGVEFTMWLETRKLTGGSRNILDLSMKSRVEIGDPNGTIYQHPDSGFMLGAVEFFGVDVRNVNDRKEITLNFEGVDYHDNSILFPEGDKANGTWRLQIKGVDDQGRKILDALPRNKNGLPLQDKILTFTKIEEDYYSMSVHPKRAITDFRLISRFIGHNGQNSQAKSLGYI